MHMCRNVCVGAMLRYETVRRSGLGKGRCVALLYCAAGRLAGYLGNYGSISCVILIDILAQAASGKNQEKAAPRARLAMAVCLCVCVCECAAAHTYDVSTAAERWAKQGRASYRSFTVCLYIFSEHAIPARTGAPARRQSGARRASCLAISPMPTHAARTPSEAPNAVNHLCSLVRNSSTRAEAIVARPYLSP